MNGLSWMIGIQIKLKNVYLEIILSTLYLGKITEIGISIYNKSFAIFIPHIYKMVYNPSQKCFFSIKYTTFLWI